MLHFFPLQRTIFLTLLTILSSDLTAWAQVDPISRELLEFGYDQPLKGQGPQGAYAYFYYNKPDFLRTNVDLRAAFAPAYLDSEIGFKHVIFPYTDMGIGINGGAFGDNYYEVRQGVYKKDESFNGSGGGGSASLYQLLNPGMLIPLNLVARGGLHYATYAHTPEAPFNFILPQNETTAFTRFGLRLAGKEPVLYPALGLELSAWLERQWRFDGDTYGFNNDRQVNAATSLYWVYGGLDYTWTNTAQKISFAVTAGGSADADRFSAWRLGGVLPLVSEFPLVLPGYYYEELTAENFVHIYGAYDFPLEPTRRFTFRVEGATAHLDYLPGFEQRSDWQTGAGCAITFTPKKKNFQIVLRYGYGFNAIRDGKQGAQSIGLLFQYDFGAGRKGGQGG